MLGKGDVVLVSLFLTLNFTPFSSVSISDFEQVKVCWVYELVIVCCVFDAIFN